MADLIEGSFPVGPHAPGQARQLVRDIALHSDAQQKLELIVSELVTNSVKHGADGTAELSVRLRRDEGYVSGEVCGGGREFRWTARDPDLEEPGGLGLVIVDQLTERWEIRRNSRVCVWFECTDCGSR